MNQPPYEPRRYYQSEEISLVDLAIILINHWKIMVLTFLIVVFGALGYVLLTGRSYEYVSLYQVAEESPGTALETPSSVLSKVNNLYVGSETRKLRETMELENLSFDVILRNPDNTMLISLVSEASEESRELITQLHEALLTRMVEGQAERLESYRSALEQRLQSTERVLQAAEQSNSENAGELIASYTERLAEIQQELTQLTEGQVVQISVQSLEPAGIGRSLVMVLAVVVGGMLALTNAFMFEFILRVRRSLLEKHRVNS